MIITGTYNRNSGAFKMHCTKFPYTSKVYLGYTLNQMKQQYRNDNNLKGKHLEWIILGVGV